MKDLHALPKVRDSLTYLYVEHARVDRDAKAVAIHDAHGKTPIPCASLTTLMLGPGTSVTHAAIETLAGNGCLVLWTGEEGVRTYAQGMGETRSAARLLHQARLWADPSLRMAVVMRLYRMRFQEKLDPALTLQQLRGHEGVRVRESYTRWSRETGVSWSGRSYNRSNWGAADPVNRALSVANSCLYGVVHAAIVSAGYSTGIGFIHTGWLLSFVYDIADLYKANVSIPVAFTTVAEGTTGLEAGVRLRCRDIFRDQRILQRIVPDIDFALRVGDGESDAADTKSELEADLPGGLWDPIQGLVPTGVNRANLLVESPGTGEGEGLSTRGCPVPRSSAANLSPSSVESMGTGSGHAFVVGQEATGEQLV